MSQRVKLSEQSMQAMEAHIPELAGAAVKRAYFQALSQSGKVLEAVNGQLVETSVEGTTRVIRTLHTPVPAVVGMKRTRQTARR